MKWTLTENILNSTFPFLPQLSVCKELQLPPSEHSYYADLLDITSSSPLESAALQSVCILVVSAEGRARFWPNLAQEGNYSETDLDLGEFCNSVVTVRVSPSNQTRN